MDKVYEVIKNNPCVVGRIVPYYSGGVGGTVGVRVNGFPVMGFHKDGTLCINESFLSYAGFRLEVHK